MNTIDQQILHSPTSGRHSSGMPLAETPRNGILGQRKSPKGARAPGYRFLLSWPIAQRLVLGFLAAAVIAATISSVTGIQHQNVLQQQAQFYRGLVDSNTQLTKANGSLQLMNSALTQVLAAVQSGSSVDSQSQSIQNVQSLASNYDSLLTDYVKHKLIEQNPDQVSLLSGDSGANLITKQRSLADSAMRSWQIYHDAQNQILAGIIAKDIATAQQIYTNLASPAHSDATQALNTLIQSGGDLANSVLAIEGAAEQSQLFITLGSALLAFVAVGLVGWFISGTIVPRLKELRDVVQSVEDGRFDSRIIVAGKDEIAQVAASVNTMLNTIVGLLEDARQQRDALAYAADHLFADMRSVGGGDLRVNAAVSNDPVGMLANAFNLTVGRFRRLVVHIRGSIQQVDTVFQQEIKHAENSVAMLKQVLASQGSSAENGGGPLLSPATVARLRQARDLVQAAANQGADATISTVLAQVEQAYRLTKQLETRSIPEVANLQQVLLKAGQQMRNLHGNMGNVLTIITSIESDTSISGQMNTLDKKQATYSSNALNLSKQELARYYLEFAQDIINATGKLRAVVQEIQVSLTTFQVEGH